MGINVRVQNAPKPDDVMAVQMNLEKDLKSCIGDEVKVTDKEGEVHLYEVAEITVVDPYDNSVKEQREEMKLTLLTCENSGTMRLIVSCDKKGEEE